MGKLVALGVAAAALAAAGIAFAATSDDTYTYRAALTKGAEVPRPTAVPAAARGTFTATVVESATGVSLRWKLTFSRLSGKVAAAHIHRGGRGAAGPVLVGLCGPCTSGKTGRAVITKAVSELIERGRAYVNVHTAKNAKGELRGQVKLLQKTSTGDDSGDPPADDGGGSGGGTDDPPPGY
jgi:hypothetical protein